MKADQIHSEVEITPKENYILVKPPPGVDFWGIYATIGKLVQMPEYQDKNDIWLFREGSMNLTFSEFQTLKEFSRKSIPKSARGKKTAIVVSTGFQSGVAEQFVADGEKYAREIRIFSDFKDAEDWVTE